MKNILNTNPPSIPLTPGPQFDRKSFDDAIWQKGYEVILERALRCPCHAPDAPLINCHNCFGTGYFFVNALRTIALITGINQNNKYKVWSQELLGTIAITVRDNDKPNLSFFDRITIKNQYSYFTENLGIRAWNATENFVFTTYKPVEVLAVYAFVGSDQQLQKVDPSLYNIKADNPYCIQLHETVVSASNVVSVYYKHEPEYRILDLPHEIRSSWVTDKKTGATQAIQLPVQAIGRRSHLINIEKPNYDGSGVIINEDV